MAEQTKPIEVLDWSSAFDFCREGNAPVRVEDTHGDTWKIYPSGSQRRLGRGLPVDVRLQHEEYQG